MRSYDEGHFDRAIVKENTIAARAGRQAQDQARRLSQAGRSALRSKTRASRVARLLETVLGAASPLRHVFADVCCDVEK